MSSTEQARDTRWGAVILAGGGGRRLGGADKAMITWAGSPLLRRAVAACGGAQSVVVVGPRRAGLDLPEHPPVQWTREDPPGAGPAAAATAGAACLPDTCHSVVLLAVDMPQITSDTVRRLRDARQAGVDAAVLADPSGQRHLAMALAHSVLSTAMPAGSSVRDLLAGRSVVDVLAHSGEQHDVDTPEDLDAAP